MNPVILIFVVSLCLAGCRVVNKENACGDGNVNWNSRTVDAVLGGSMPKLTEAIKCGGSPNSKVEIDGVSVLMIASGMDKLVRPDWDKVSSGDLKGIEDQFIQVSYLIDVGAEVNYQSKYGWTPLMAASYNGRVGTVIELLCRGADRSSKNNEGKTALDYAKINMVEKVIADWDRFRSVCTNHSL